MSRIRQAVIYSSLSRYGLRLLGLVSTMLVSRLLTPEEIGTFAVASAVVMIMSEFRMLGAGGYLIREEVIDESKVRSALGLTLLISWGVGFLILVSAIPLSRFYDLPAIAPIFIILSLSFFLAPYISLPVALLSRHMMFGVQLKVKLLAAITGFIATIGLILLGFSYYSLAIGQVASVVVTFVLFIWFRPTEMVWLPRFNDMKPVASFGIFNSLSNFFRKSQETLPDMILGKMGTTAQVAMFSRGLGLVNFLSQTIVMGVAPVALPFLSEVRRKGGDVSAAYIRATAMLSALVIPVLIVASLASLPIIRMFFGNQWDAAAPLSAWLCLWAALRSTIGFSNELLVSFKREKVMVIKDALVFAMLLVVIIVSFNNGELEQIAQGFVLVGAFEVILTLAILRHFTCISFQGLAEAWIPNVIITAGCALMTILIGNFIDFSAHPAWHAVVAIALIMPPWWLLLLRLCRHPLMDEIWWLVLSVYQRRSG